MRAEIVISDISNPQELASCLSPEVTEDLAKTSMEVDIGIDSLKIKIAAEDVSSLRAALNSYLRWLRIATETNNIIGGFDDE